MVNVIPFGARHDSGAPGAGDVPDVGARRFGAALGSVHG